MNDSIDLGFARYRSGRWYVRLGSGVWMEAFTFDDWWSAFWAWTWRKR